MSLIFIFDAVNLVYINCLVYIMNYFTGVCSGLN